MIPTPQPDACRIKAELMVALQQAHSVAIGISEQEAEAAMRGDVPGCVALAPTLEEARQKRKEAMEALKAHIAEHHC